MTLTMTLTLLAISANTINHGLTAAMWWFAILWLGCLGGCVGSFLERRLGPARHRPGDRLPALALPRVRPRAPLVPQHADPRLADAPRPLLRLRRADRDQAPVVEAIFAALFIAIGLSTPWL